MKKNENYERTFFHFNYYLEKIRKADIEFPINITVGEMMKATFSKLLLNSKSTIISFFIFHFLFEEFFF